jgi:hypothetical protein
MSLENLSISDLQAEIERRKSAETGELRSKLEEHKKAIRELEAKIAANSGKAARSAGARSRSNLTDGEKTDKILSALDGKGFTTADALSELVGFDGGILRGALSDLIAEGKVVKEGKARGTKYKLA